MTTQKKANKPKLTILGRGAIGVLLASYLRHQFDIQFLVRAKPSGDQNIRFHDINGSIIDLHCAIVTLDDVACIEHLLVPVKSYQVLDALRQVKDKLARNATVIVSHNGMPDLSQLNRFFNHQQLFFLTTSMAALKLSDYVVKHTGTGASFLGSLNADHQPNRVTQTLLNALPQSEQKKDIYQLLWQKLLINIAINPLTAVFQINNGALVSPRYAHDILGLLNEAVFVAQRAGISITLSTALNNAYQVMRATQKNFSSMNRDVYYNRATEIDSMCGYIVKKAAEYDYSTPYNQKYLSLILGDKL